MDHQIIIIYLNRVGHPFLLASKCFRHIYPYPKISRKQVTFILAEPHTITLICPCLLDQKLGEARALYLGYQVI